MNAREEILGRIRRALADVEESDPTVDVPVEWRHGQPTDLRDILDVFEENILDYGARLVRVPEADVPAAIASALGSLGATSVVVPPGSPPGWSAAAEAAGIAVVLDEPPLAHDSLDRVDAVVTGSAVAMAETGTICLDHGPGQGRRALSLVPDRHVCVVRADAVVSDVAEAVAILATSIRQRPVTWISGGSATSDIELARVEGVHGPRQLWVILAG